MLFDFLFGVGLGYLPDHVADESLGMLFDG